jgi:hexokinase
MSNQTKQTEPEQTEPGFSKKLEQLLDYEIHELTQLPEEELRKLVDHFLQSNNSNFECNSNHLTRLPDLPTSLETLGQNFEYKNNLIVLPNIPNKLLKLDYVYEPDYKPSSEYSPGRSV